MKKIIIIFLLSFVIGSGVYADVIENNSFAYTYLFHLYYDNGQLFADRDVKFKYDIIAEIFVPETLNTQFPYKGEIVNLKGEVAKMFQFDPRQGNPKFLKGTLSVKAPYVPDGQKAVFYNNQGDALLTIFVSESSFCNDDGVCNPDVGEDTKTCPSDCKQVLPVPIASPEVPVGGQGSILMNLIYVLIIAGVGLGGWFGGSAIWRRWKGRQTPPMVQFPQETNV